MPDTAVGFRELRQKLARYLREANQGAAFVVTSRGQVLARLGPLAVRVMGILKGQIHISDDFDETPSASIDAMEGESDLMRCAD